MINKLIIITFCTLVATSTFAQKTWEYPVAEKGTFEDIYFGDTISDPYQWMEDPTDPRLAIWLEEQQQLTKKISRKRKNILTFRDRLASMYYVYRKKTKDYTPIKTKDKYEFEESWDRLDKTPNLVYRPKGEGRFRSLVKVKKFREKRTDNIRFELAAINEENDLVVITISKNGSDWRTGFVFDLNTGEQLQDTLKYLRIGSNVEWHRKDLLYDGYQAPKMGKELLEKAKGQKLLRHKLGSRYEEDEVIYINPDTTGTKGFGFSIDKERILLYHHHKVKEKIFNSISIADIDQTPFFPKNLLIYPATDSIEMEVEHINGDSLYIKTNFGAPNGRVLLLNINQPNAPSELIPEYDILLSELNPMGLDKLAGIYRKDGQNISLIFNLQGEVLEKIEFPKGKKLNGFYEYNSDVKETSFMISSFFHPPLWYQFSLDSLTFKPIQSVSVPYDPESLETRYVKYKSKDGTVVPMYLTMLKDLELDGTNPVLMEVYGGYGVTIEPEYNSALGLWLLNGGILAVPNIRGGGAEGKSWALQGRRLKKQNAIDDVIAAAEFLVKEKYTCRKKLAIRGGSHGGLMVGAVITQRPNLFRVAVAEAGVYDMLRAGKFTVLSVSTNINEFGTVLDSSDYRNLKNYSPLLGVEEEVQYPNLLIITGDSDDRVPPLHSYKFLATLQEKGSGEGLYHLYLTPGSGHAGALTLEHYREKEIYEYYFLFDQLGIEIY